MMPDSASLQALMDAMFKAPKIICSNSVNTRS